MIRPIDHMVIVSLLVQEKRVLEALHDSHIQMRLLLEAGDSRYLGWAVDELDAATEELADLDRARRSITFDDTADQCFDSAPAPTQRTLTRLTEEIDELLGRVEAERAQARRLCHARMQPESRPHR